MVRPTFGITGELGDLSLRSAARRWWTGDMGGEEGSGEVECAIGTEALDEATSAAPLSFVVATGTEEEGCKTVELSKELKATERRFALRASLRTNRCAGWNDKVRKRKKKKKGYF
jgi:hypothetical protein